MPPDFFRLCPGWTEFFYSDEIQPLLDRLDLPSEWFRPFYATPLASIRVVICCRPDQFPIDPTYGRLSSFLQRIYQDLEDDGGYPTRDGSFEHWTKQGVLFLYEYPNISPDYLYLMERLSEIIGQKQPISLDFLENKEHSNHIRYEKGGFKKINRMLSPPLYW